MPRLAISLLGPFEVTLDGTPVTRFGAGTARALLAYLALYPRVSHRRVTLAGLLWPDQPEGEARHNLAQAIYRLRTAIGDRQAARPYLEVSRQAIRFSPDGGQWSDVETFDTLVAATEAHGHERLDSCPSCAERLRKAADLYRGEFLSGFSLDSALYEEWLVHRREALHRKALGVLHDLAAYYEAQGEYEAAIRYARRQVALEPWHEGGHRQVMRCLALSGERAGALAQYEVCRRILAQELDAEPGPATTALYQRLRAGDPLPTAIQPRPVPTDRTIAAPGNLPAQPTRFVGRERELDELAELLAAPGVRVVTIVGAGGMGKTRLALQVAGASSACYPAGAWVVELATVPDDESVPRAIAAALGVREQPSLSLPETIAVSLQTRELLLILDNCEHVVEGAAGLASFLIGRCPQLSVLATSREPLRIPGEQLYEVPPLGLPGSDAAFKSLLEADAVQLLAERAAAVRPGYALDGERAALAARVCRRLDGMPLAIELTAARLRALSLAEIARRLDDRFRLLTRGGRMAPPRHRTLRNAVDWSYELLSEPERLLFDRLSVFRGSFDLAGAEAVCAGGAVAVAEVLNLLAGLVDRSLVTARETADGVTRYGLLETLRQYAAERLAEQGKTEQIAERHARYYVALTEAAEPDLESWGIEMLLARKRLDTEVENLAAAMRWSLAHRQPELALRLGGAARWWVLWAAGSAHNHQYVEWLESALASGRKAELCYQGKALGTISMCALNLGHFGKWRAAWKEELACAHRTGASELIAKALCGAGLTFAQRGRLEPAPARRQESLQTARDGCSLAAAKWALCHLAQFEPWERQRWLLEELLSRAPYGAIDYYLARRLGGTAEALGDLEEAEARLRFSAEGFGEWGMVREQVWTSIALLAHVAAMQGDYNRAARLLEQSRDQCRRSGLITILAWTLNRMGILTWQCGDLDAAERHYTESLVLTREHAIERHEAWCLIGLARVACERGEVERAQTLCTQAQGRFGEYDPRSHVDLPSILARVALCRGHAAGAGALYRESLEHSLGPSLPGQGRPHVVEALEALGWALAADGQHDLGTRLLACAARERDEMGLVRYPVDRPYQERALAALRAGLDAVAFDAAWALGGALSLEDAIAAGLGTGHE